MKAKGVIAFALACCAFFVGCESKGSTHGMTAAHHESSKECDKMSSEEQSFAAKLRPYNQKVFCEEMSYSQRKEAMRLARHGDYEYGRGKYFSPDAAVEKVSDQRKTTGRSYRRSCQS